MRPRLLLLLLPFALAIPVQAGSIRWDLVNVVFNDGGTASGYFVAGTDPLCAGCYGYPVTEWSISTSGGQVNFMPPLTYTPDNSSGNYFWHESDEVAAGVWSLMLLTNILGPPGQDGSSGWAARMLIFQFQDFPGEARAVNPLVYDLWWGKGTECWNCGGRMVVSDGYATGSNALPEPGGLALAGAGLIALIAAGSRRRRALRG